MGNNVLDLLRRIGRGAWHRAGPGIQATPGRVVCQGAGLIVRVSPVFLFVALFFVLLWVGLSVVSFVYWLAG